MRRNNLFSGCNEQFWGATFPTLSLSRTRGNHYGHPRRFSYRSSLISTRIKYPFFGFNYRDFCFFQVPLGPVQRNTEIRLIKRHTHTHTLRLSSKSSDGFVCREHAARYRTLKHDNSVIQTSAHRPLSTTPTLVPVVFLFLGFVLIFDFFFFPPTIRSKKVYTGEKGNKKKKKNKT